MTRVSESATNIPPPRGLLEGGSPLPGSLCCQDSFMSLGSRVPVQPDRRTGQQKAMVPRSFRIWKLTRSDSCPASELLSSEMGLAHFLFTPPCPFAASLFLPLPPHPPPAFFFNVLGGHPHTCGVSRKGTFTKGQVCSCGGSGYVLWGHL